MSENRAVALATLVAALLIAALQLSSAVDCGQVEATLAPCIMYLREGGEAPPQGCCDAIKILVSLTPTRQDRQSACECLKAAASTDPNIKADVAANLAGRCGVTTSVPISANVNCQNVS